MFYIRCLDQYIQTHRIVSIECSDRLHRHRVFDHLAVDRRVGPALRITEAGGERVRHVHGARPRPAKRRSSRAAKRRQADSHGSGRQRRRQGTVRRESTIPSRLQPARQCRYHDHQLHS